MKKLLVLSLAAVAVGANASWQYTNNFVPTTHQHPFYYPWMASDPIADDVTLANTGPSNVFVFDMYAVSGYTGDIVFNGWDDDGVGDPSGATGSLFSETSNFTLTAGLWTITRLLPVTAFPDTSAWIGTTLSNHPGDNSVGPLIGLTPLVGASADYWGERNAGVWNYWTYGGNPLGNMAYGIAGIGTLMIETTEGFELGGDINSVQLSDNEFYSAFPDEVTLSCTIHGTGDTMDPAPTQLDYTLEYMAGRVGLSYSARLKNMVTNNYVQIMGGVAATADETVTGSITTSAGNFVDANGGYEFQIVFAPINEEDPAQDGWPLSIDVVDVSSI